MPAYPYTLLSFAAHDLYYHPLYIVLVVLYHSFPPIRMFQILLDGLIRTEGSHSIRGSVVGMELAMNTTLYKYIRQARNTDNGKGLGRSGREKGLVAVESEEMDALGASLFDNTTKSSQHRTPPTSPHSPLTLQTRRPPRVPA